MESIRPVSPPAPYLGGKRNLARRISALIAAIPHQTYVEPFVGMGGVFFRRDQRPTAEVVNDISGDVATLFRILQEHYAYFVDMLRWRLTSRAEFERLRALPADRLTDLHRAARFLYLQKTAFGGKIEGRTFGVDRRSPGRFDVTKIEPMLADLHERLAGVVIEQLPYAECIRRYDGPETLFYLDPPYFGCEDDYGAVFAPADFQRLAEQLYGISGKFILSINDAPEIREIFGAFTIEVVGTTYSIGTSHGTGKPTGELIITNAHQPDNDAAQACSVKAA